MDTKIAAGRLNRLVALDTPIGKPVADGDGGYTQDYRPLSPPTMWASIEPATARDLQRVAGTTLPTATHIVTMRFHQGVTLQTRIRYDGRVFDVVGRANPGEADALLVLPCLEVTS